MTEGVHRVALITGASRGVGASIATMLADRGFNVVINYHSKRSRAEDVAADVQVRGGRALIVQAEHTRPVIPSLLEALTEWRPGSRVSCYRFE
jgi:NAD(P)-dependent dehydrogenase (short-subunit alcohol dehydrogenase family)